MASTTRPTMRLAEFRRASGRTQAEVAEQMELSRSTVSRLERSDDMTVSRLQQFVRACGGHVVFEVDFPDDVTEAHHPQTT